MKTLRVKKKVSRIVCAAVFCAGCAGYAETVTIWADSPAFVLNTNDVAQCVYLRLIGCTGGQSTLTIQPSNHCGTCQVTVTNQNDRPVVVGPASVSIYTAAACGGLAGANACTFQITRAADSFTP